jgi:hypothetical protein
MINQEGYRCGLLIPKFSFPVKTEENHEET